MPANWRLRDLLKERGVNRASEISRILEENGYQLSVQAVCDLLNAQPKMIRLETIQALCDAFYIRLSEFLDVLPVASQKPQRKRRALNESGFQHGQVQTRSDEGAQRASNREAGPNVRRVDYAAFYPDARKFSSDSTKV